MPSPDDDAARLQALERYAVLDAHPRRELEALVELAARFAGVPMATINLITDSEQVQVATYGFTGGRAPREDSFCTTVLDERRPILIEDARLDERFAANPHTTGERDAIRFYGAHPLVTPEGVIIGTLCVYDQETHEVTPQVAAALETLADRVVDVLELELTSRRLVAANERLRAFAGQVSHDLRNPLAAVEMSLGLVHDRLAAASADPGLLNLLERAERGTSRMGATIGALLRFAHVGTTLEPVRFSLAETVHDVLEDLGTETATHPVQVQDLPTVVGDAVQLRLVLQNLLSNAMRFSPAGTQVSVSGETLAGGGWRIAVTDQGPGVPKDDRERIFDPLVRLDATVPGTGLGLATARGIIEAHGGRIGLDESPCGGARAWFELPDVEGP